MRGYKKRYFILLGAILLLSTSNFAQDNFRRIDKYAQRTPEKFTQSLSDLSAYLCEPAQTELEKVRSIFVWITHHLQYDESAYNNGNRRINQNNADILRRRKAVCFGYANLFQALCQEAGLQVEVISGYSKGTITAQPNLDEADHAWNAVKIDSQWYLLDATWGSSLIDEDNIFVQQKEDTYFLTKPENFIQSHLPNLPMWQLLPCPISPTLFSQPADSINQFLQLNPDTCFSFPDSIAYFLSLNQTDRLLWNAKQTFQFNPSPSNQKNLGHSLFDYAGLLAERAELLQSTGPLDSLTILQESILHSCQKAVALCKPYNWQKELYINTLINQAVALYQMTDEAEKPKVLYQKALRHINSANELMERMNNSLFVQYARQQCEEIQVVLESLIKD